MPIPLGDKLMFTVDKYNFEKRGATGCSNSDYRVAVLTCCGRQVVEDDELSDLYFNPADLSKKVSLLRTRDVTPDACPLCRSTDWDLVPLDNLGEVSEEWRWACPRT